MYNFYIQVKSSNTDDVVKELGPMYEKKAMSVADGMDINMSDEYYTEIVERVTNDVNTTNNHMD